MVFFGMLTKDTECTHRPGTFHEAKAGAAGATPALDVLHEFACAIDKGLLHDLAGLRYSSGERLGEVQGLSRLDIRRKRGGERVNDRFQQSGPWSCEKVIQRVVDVGRIVHAHAICAASFRKHAEVHRLQPDAELGIAFHHHLFPLDLAEVVVLNHHDLDGQVVLHGCEHFEAEHAEATVADEGYDLSFGIGDLGGDGVGQTRSHGGEIAGEAV